MAAYSAVASLRQSLKELLDSDEFPLDLPKPQFQSLYEKICYLQSFLEEIGSSGPKKWMDRIKELKQRIRDAVYAAQDKIDYSISKRLPPQELDEMPFQKIVNDIDLVKMEAGEMAEAMKKETEIENLSPPENLVVPSPISDGKAKFVGLEDELDRLMYELLSQENKRIVIPITGMGGIGKTTLARRIYEHPGIKSSFPFRAWVTVSQQYNLQEICSNLLASMESRSYQAGHYAFQGGEEELMVRLHQMLYNNKYLIVMDDIWEARFWDEVKRFLPDNRNGSRILITTRLSNIAEHFGFNLEMRGLGADQSWELLREKAFGGEPCPPELEGIGRRIAEKSGGLPLTIVVIGGLLAQQRGRGDVEYWKMIEENINTLGTESQALEILSLSYNHLPDKLKGCFLYMGAFPEDAEIRVSKLINLWIAEGLVAFPPSSTHDQGLELAGLDSLKMLIDRNLVLVHKRSPNGQIKFVRMHDLLRDLAVLESTKEKFFHSRKKYAQEVENDVQVQRRVSIHRNILMCVEQVYNTTKSIKYARTLLYVGPHHHYPLPFCLTFDLLRVLDAFTVYFVDFPEEFLQLVHLRYLSLTYNDDLPSKISQLRRLQVLMVRREPKLIFVGVSFLPDEIWEMPELRHLWLTETDFPALPPTIDELRPRLVNLHTLSNVNAAFFDDHILDNMPNLKKLAMWIEAPDVAISFNLDKLSKLQNFRFVVMNPIRGKCIQVQLEHFFPKTLQKLSLSGCGLPWKYMEVVAALPDLEVLKLLELAFHGEEWCVNYKLERLKFLLIEYLDFQKWEVDGYHFPSLQHLILRHCYVLEEIPSDIGDMPNLKMIELVDCSPAAVESAEQILEEQQEWGNEDLQLLIFSSWK